ncbi:MAG TPA: nickel pincer cofactor biosynthesis protein LarB [Thermodesulfovibrionia bacterium]|nr:nickel pincer cofactor biosynthesis protein LarB [Thermodesulfovibrionia bacterium]
MSLKDKTALLEALQTLIAHNVQLDHILPFIKNSAYEDLSVAKLDIHRQARQGIPEVIFAEGKTVDDVTSIVEAMINKGHPAFVTRAQPACYTAISEKQGNRAWTVQYNQRAKTILVYEGELKQQDKGNVLVLCAGTSDISVAEEAVETAQFLGSKVSRAYDVGVAGIHRLFDSLGLIKEARVLIVVAGMEGALPSVVGGFTDKPMIAVPTSVGYGTSLGGLTALFAMLNSCVPGIAVMNIDNGFGAGCLAHKINTLAGL